MVTLFIYLFIYFNINFSSKAAGDFGSCSGELETECLKCDSASHRDLVSATGKCRCNNGTYDDGENNTCADCHYSWLLISFILLIIYNFFSSHKDGDYDSCSGIDKTECKTCNEAKHRVLVGGLTGECKCNNGTYDNSVVETCVECHYSW